VTVMIQINYNNYNPFAYSTTQFPFYTYTVEIGTTYAAAHQVTWNGNGATNGSRLFENRHGIKIYIQQEGQLGKINVVQLMLFFGSAAAFFGFAAFFVDQIVIRFFVSARTKELLDLASNTNIPTRSELEAYVKSVEKEMGGEYEPPTTFWEVEKEWIEQAETEGKHKPRPNFAKTGVIEMQQMLAREKEERGAEGVKSNKELQLNGALAFARSISGVPQPELHRAMSTEARMHWRQAKDGVYAQVRATNKPSIARVRSALAGRSKKSPTTGGDTSSLSESSSFTAPAGGLQRSSFQAGTGKVHDGEKKGYAPL